VETISARLAFVSVQVWRRVVVTQISRQVRARFAWCLPLARPHWRRVA
jgi:hypothetical protein